MKKPQRYHIAIEGTIGSGKTTLAKKLARFRKARLLLEAFEKHRFLADFYANPGANAFETEMHFLLLHYNQLKLLRVPLRSEIISDFTFFKDKIFAELTLKNNSEYMIFKKLYAFLLKRLIRPDLIIYLKGTDELILRRIRSRNRSIEQKMDLGYLKQLNRKYDHFFMAYGREVVVVNTDQFDCMGNPTLIQELSRKIDSQLSD